MPVTPDQVFRADPAVEYDGSNGADILAWMAPADVTTYDIALDSDTGGVAVFSCDDGAGPRTETYNTGDYVYVSGGVAKIPASEIANGHYVLVSTL
jgi:hypothetical protein